GQPVPEGLVTFSSEKTGIAAPATLNDKGEFTIPKGIEVGEYQVTITPPDPEDVAGAPPVTSTPKDYSNIPQAYRSLTTSELRATVERGDNSFEFEMKKQQ